MKKLFLLIVLFVFGGALTLMAQTNVITGTVVSSVEGEGPIPGVTVQVKGTTIGAISDVNGKYTISVPASTTTLVFSYIGMKTADVEIAGRSVIDVTLESDLIGLNEVVVTAMGISREKKSLGYSVQDISTEEISRAGNPNLATNLSGKIAGVEVRQSSGMPGAPSTIFIRGARSFDGNNQPLYVVDGMPIASGSDYSQNVTGSYASSRALDNLRKGLAPKPYVVQSPMQITIDLISSDMADRVSRLPGAQRVGNKISFSSPDMDAAYKTFRAAAGLASLS